MTWAPRSPTTRPAPQICPPGFLGHWPLFWGLTDVHSVNPLESPTQLLSLTTEEGPGEWSLPLTGAGKCTSEGTGERTPWVVMGLARISKCSPKCHLHRGRECVGRLLGTPPGGLFICLFTFQRQLNGPTWPPTVTRPPQACDGGTLETGHEILPL